LKSEHVFVALGVVFEGGKDAAQIFARLIKSLLSGILRESFYKNVSQENVNKKTKKKISEVEKC
jgi:hypothetical protein